MAARQAMIVGGRRMGRRTRINREQKWEGIPMRELNAMNFENCCMPIDLPLVQSRELNTIEIAGEHRYEHFKPTKVKRISHNKNMRRYHRVHQPGFDTQRRPIKN